MSRRHKKIATKIEAQALDYLMQQEWSGNVRELRNVMETAVILATSETITLADLSTDFFQSTNSPLINESITESKTGIFLGMLE